MARCRSHRLSPDGSSRSLPGQIIEWRDEEGHRCAIIHYTAPGGVWKRFEVAPWTNGRLALIALCGTTETAVQIKEDDEGVRGDLINLFTPGGPGNFGITPTTCPVWLEDNAIYEVRINWQWRGWTPPFDNAPEPPPPDDNNWESAVIDRYRFRTAAFGQAKDPTPDEKPDPSAPPPMPYPEDVFVRAA